MARDQLERGPTLLLMAPLSSLLFSAFNQPDLINIEYPIVLDGALRTAGPSPLGAGKKKI